MSKSNLSKFLFTHWQIILLNVGWITLFCCVAPFGNNPLNDDWSYSFTVKELFENGNYALTPWNAAPLFTQVLWGILFCLPFGFSFLALKISTIAIGLIGLITTFKIIEKISSDKTISFFFTAIIGLNPIYFSLSATFMTDIHFFSWFAISLYTFIIFDESGKTKHWILATLFTILAVLTRQFGVVLPLALLLFSIINKRHSGLRTIGLYLISTLLTLCCYFGYLFWLNGIGELPPVYSKIGSVFFNDFSALAFKTFMRIGYISIETGFWLLPISISFFIKNLSFIRQNITLISLVSLVLILPLIRVYSLFPLGNIINDSYVGPLTTFDTHILHQYKIFQNPSIWKFLRPIALMGGIILITVLVSKTTQLIRSIKTMDRTPLLPIERIQVMTTIIGVLYIGIMFINHMYFDRYLLPLFLLVAILMGQIEPSKHFKTIAISGILITMTISLVTTKNYFNRQDAVWDLAHIAIKKGIPASEIDGGHEFNGWYGTEINSLGQWDYEKKSFVISFSEINNTEIIDRLTYKRVFDSKPYNVYLSKKIK